MIFLFFFQKKLYIFGGIKDKAITNELWEFNTLKKTWRMLTVSGATPVGVTGHAAVVVVNQMYVFMGYSSEKSYYQNVQQLDLGKCERLNEATDHLGLSAISLDLLDFI